MNAKKSEPLYTITIRHVTEQDLAAIRFVIGDNMKFKVEAQREN